LWILWPDVSRWELPGYSLRRLCADECLFWEMRLWEKCENKHIDFLCFIECFMLKDWECRESPKSTISGWKHEKVCVAFVKCIEDTCAQASRTENTAYCMRVIPWLDLVLFTFSLMMTAFAFSPRFQKSFPSNIARQKTLNNSHQVTIFPRLTPPGSHCSVAICGSYLIVGGVIFWAGLDPTSYLVTV
jgi:hypothetical protein